MEQQPNRKNPRATQESTSRPNKLTIQEVSEVKETSQSTLNSSNAMGTNITDSAISKSKKNRAWVQRTINPQRRVTASPHDRPTASAATPPDSTVEVSEIQQRINGLIRTDDETMTSPKRPNHGNTNKNTDENTDRPKQPSTASESPQRRTFSQVARGQLKDDANYDEPLEDDPGSTSAATYDLPYFVDHLPIELLSAYENEKFTTADVNYALNQGRATIGDEEFNEFSACRAFNEYLHDVMKFDLSLANSATNFPPEPPSRAPHNSKSPFRTPTDQRRTGSPTHSNASASGNSEPSADSADQWSDNSSIGLTKEEKQQRNRKNEKSNKKRSNN
jgi:hypothetical protein